MIKITVEKVLNDEQEKSFKIVKIEGIRRKETFGKNYYCGCKAPFVDTNDEGKKILIFEDYPHLIEEKILTEDWFFRCLEYIKKAGERAHQCAQEIKKLKATWKGQETFII